MAGHLVLALSVVLAGCFGACQVTADNPTAAGSLRSTVEDKDAGPVGIASAFEVKSYHAVAVTLLPVTDPSVKDDGDRRTPRPRSCADSGRAGPSRRSSP